MLVPWSNTKIYLCTGLTDMRKGVNGLSLLAQDILSNQFSSGAMFVFRGKSATRIKILWWLRQEVQIVALLEARVLIEMEDGPLKPLITRRLQTT